MHACSLACVHKQIDIGSHVSLTVGVVSGVDTSLTHLSLTWHSRQHFASDTHTHIQPLLLRASIAASWIKFYSFPEDLLVSILVSPKKKKKSYLVWLRLLNSRPPVRTFSWGWRWDGGRGGGGVTFWMGPEQAHVTRAPMRAGGALPPACDKSLRDLTVWQTSQGCERRKDDGRHLTLQSFMCTDALS